VSYTLHPGAEQDITDALALLVEFPGIGTPGTRGRRMFPLQVFPYSVVYRSVEEGIHIVVVRHQRRKPGYGGSRR
jgi:toxin ParE1/3/4